MLRNYVHSEDPFCSNHPAPVLPCLPPQWPIMQPGPPPDPARRWPVHLSCPACHSVLPGPACLPSLHPCPSSSGTTASRMMQSSCAGAVMVLLQRLSVWGASQNTTPSQANILHTPSNILRILCTPSNILCTLSNTLCTPCNIIRTPSYILSNPQVILVCDGMDTRLARPLSRGQRIVELNPPLKPLLWIEPTLEAPTSCHAPAKCSKVHFCIGPQQSTWDSMEK